MKNGVRLHNASDVDDVWRTCCALHNWLLEADGLNARWERGVNVSDYLADMGLHDGPDAGRFVPVVFSRATHPRQYDLSGMGPGDDPDYDADSTPAIPNADGAASGSLDGIVRVKDMSQLSFRRKLIEHFAIKWRRREVTWPSRTGTVEWQPL